MTAHQWHSAGTDEPGDQQRDLEGPYWAEVGPDGRGGWSWEVFDFDQDNAGVAFGRTDTEQAAKAAVEGWKP